MKLFPMRKKNHRMNSLKSIQYYFIALEGKIMVLLLLLLLLKILVKKGSTCNQKYIKFSGKVIQKRTLCPGRYFSDLD